MYSILSLRIDHKLLVTWRKVVGMSRYLQKCIAHFAKRFGQGLQPEAK